MSPSKTTIGRAPRQCAGGFLARFGAAREAFAAVEFALIAPFMIATYFGVTELCDAYAAGSKVTSVASTAADLVAQENAVCNAEMDDVFEALDAILFPYPAENMQIVVSSLIDAGNGTIRVAWSDGHNASPLAVNSLVTIPDGLVTAGGSVIFAEVTYNYESPAGHLIYGVRPISDKFYTHPRRAVQIARSASNC